MIIYCIICDFGDNPLFYTGYFTEGRPVTRLSFDEAAGFCSAEIAQIIVDHLPGKYWKVEPYTIEPLPGLPRGGRSRQLHNTDPS